MNKTNKTTSVVPQGLIESACAVCEIDDVNTFKRLIATYIPVPSTHNAYFKGLIALLSAIVNYKLNPLKKQIYAIKMGDAVIITIGVDGWFHILANNPKVNGVLTEDIFDEERRLVAVKVELKRKDWDSPLVITHYLEGQNKGTVWKQYPKRMLRNRAIAEAIRIGLGLSLGYYDSEDADGQEEGFSLTDDHSSEYEEKNKLIKDIQSLAKDTSTEISSVFAWATGRIGDINSADLEELNKIKKALEDRAKENQGKEDKEKENQGKQFVTTDCKSVPSENNPVNDNKDLKDLKNIKDFKDLEDDKDDKDDDYF